VCSLAAGASRGELAAISMAIGLLGILSLIDAIDELGDDLPSWIKDHRRWVGGIGGSALLVGSYAALVITT
jgi:hypothetical protein